MIGKMVLHDGAWAEYAALPEDMLAIKPRSLDFVHSATLPLAGVAALNSVDAVHPGKGDVVLIVGATGGVGSYAVQIAARRGAKVIATGLPQDRG